jgi:hypothetical protein
MKEIVMKTIYKVVLAGVLQACAIGMPLFVGGLQNAQAKENACSTKPRSVYDQRLLENSDRGEKALRRYVENKQAKSGIDWPTAQARVERLRRERDACEVRPVPGQ